MKTLIWRQWNFWIFLACKIFSRKLLKLNETPESLPTANGLKWSLVWVLLASFLFAEPQGPKKKMCFRIMVPRSILIDEVPKNAEIFSLPKSRCFERWKNLVSLNQELHSINRDYHVTTKVIRDYCSSQFQEKHIITVLFTNRFSYFHFTSFQPYWYFWSKLTRCRKGLVKLRSLD